MNNMFETLRSYSHAPHTILENPSSSIVRVVLGVTARVVIVVILVAITGSGHIHARRQTLHNDAEIVETNVQVGRTDPKHKEPS